MVLDEKNKKMQHLTKKRVINEKKLKILSKVMTGEKVEM
jgi:hypothetical protein